MYKEKSQKSESEAERVKGRLIGNEATGQCSYGSVGYCRYLDFILSGGGLLENYKQESYV